MPLYCLSNQLDLFLPEAFVLLSSPLVLFPWSLPLLGESSTERTVLCLTFCFMCLLTVTSVRTGHFFSRWACLLDGRLHVCLLSAVCPGHSNCSAITLGRKGEPSVDRSCQLRLRCRWVSLTPFPLMVLCGSVRISSSQTLGGILS